MLVRRHPLLLGEHADEVLQDVLGYTPEEIADLTADARSGVHN